LSSILNLGDVEETLLIPLYMRALETARPDSIIHDPKSVEIVGQLDYDFEKFAGAWMQQIEVAVRTEIIDEQVGKFLRAQPDATVVNLGAGLDSRYLRLDNRQVRWYELDTPPVIDLRRRFYQETDRNRFIGKSMFDDAWYEEIGVTTGRDVMLIAEGLLPYFSPHQVRELLKTIADRLPQAKLLFQSISPFYVNSQQRVAGLNQTRGVLRWGIRRASDLRKWDPRIKPLDEWWMIDRHQARWRWLGKLAYFPPIRRHVGQTQKLSLVEFQASAV